LSSKAQKTTIPHHGILFMERYTPRAPVERNRIERGKLKFTSPTRKVRWKPYRLATLA
jgi:hypothetical protein